jgi:hypothetical protein
MDILNKNELRSLMGRKDFSCISIYMPTYRKQPEAKQNPIRFKNLLKRMEEQLIACGFRRSEAEALSAPGKALVGDLLFWQYQSDGFAAFMSSNWFRYYRLPLSFEELLVITDRFHVKPLLPFFAHSGRFYVLALSQNEVRLFQCSRYSVTEIELKNIPGSLNETLRSDEPSRHLQFHTKTPGGRGERAAIFHGHGAGKDEDKNRILKFFRQVDQGLQKILGEDPVPLVLAGVDYLLPIYREASTSPQLMRQGIPGSPEGLKPGALQKEAWTIVEPHFLKALEDSAARYKELAGSGLTSSDVETIALAAYQGRVDLLFAAVGVQQWGVFDPATQSVHLHKKNEPGDEDLLDFAAVHTVLKGGIVHALKPKEMPGGARLAAVFRY